MSRLFSILAFTICLFGVAFSGPCADADLLYIINRGTGHYLAVNADNHVVLNYNYQQWCLNDQSRSFYTPLANPSKSAANTGIVFYNDNGDNVLNVQNGVLSNAVLNLVPAADAHCHDAAWEITYLSGSGMFSIRTIVPNSELLAVSAVSTDPADGVTLKPFNADDTLQQWILQR